MDYARYRKYVDADRLLTGRKTKMDENDCCANCKFNLELVKFDYSKGGCIHTKYDGYACMVFASEGLVVHMVGVRPETGMCEMFCNKGEKEMRNE